MSRCSSDSGDKNNNSNRSSGNKSKSSKRDGNLIPVTLSIFDFFARHRETHSQWDQARTSRDNVISSITVAYNLDRGYSERPLATVRLNVRKKLDSDGDDEPRRILISG